MKIALDPYMIRHVPLLELPGVVAGLGYDWIELSPREDFIPFFRHPRVDDRTVAKFRKALDAAGVGILSVLPLFRWSGPDEDERQAAVRYWKRSIQIAADLGVTSMISEFNGRPEEPSRSEAQFWKSMDELLPLFQREGIRLALEPHPDDFIENGYDAVNLIRGINHPNVTFLYCAPHTPSTSGTTHRESSRTPVISSRTYTSRMPSTTPRPPATANPQPARHPRPRPPAPGHRPGRGRLL